MGENKEGPSRSMYKGHMEKVKGVMFEGGRQGLGDLGEGVKMDTTVLEQQ